MGVSREEIERALEGARAEGDEAAVRGLTEMLEKQQGALPEPVYKPGEASALINEQSDPLPPSPLAEKPPLASESDIDSLLEQRQAEDAARQEKRAEVEGQKPWGDKTQVFFDKMEELGDEVEANKWDKAQKQYEADQALLDDPENVPSQDEIDDWIKAQQRASTYTPLTGMGPALYMPPPTTNTKGRQVVRDPETGRLRWTALPPAAIYGKDKEKPTLTGMLTGAVASETINAVGRRVEDIEQTEQGINTMQKYIFSSLPPTERERVRNELARSYKVDPSKMTDDAIINKVHPYKLKEIIDQNEANQSIYEEIRKQEGGVLERAKRAGTKISRGLAGAITFDETKDKLIDESNLFGAEAPEAPVFGADTPLGYWLNKWEDRAQSEGMGASELAYKAVIEPFKNFDPDLELGSTIRYSAEKMQEKAYGEEYERIKKPLLKPGTELTWEDLTNPETYMSDEASILDPLAMAVKTAEQLPNMAPGVVGSFAGGKIASRMYRAGTGQLTGKGLSMSIREVERLARKKAITGGLIGNAVGNSIVYDHVSSEIRDTMSMVPDEILMENPKIKMLMAAGLTFPEAKQLTVQETAASAGRGAWAGSTVLSAPTAGLAGLGGGGTLLARNRAASAGAALTLSGLEEGAQELYEGYVSDVSIEALDPENPVLKDKGRYAERFFGGAVMGLTAGGPLEVTAAIQQPQPGGIDKETQDAAQKTMDFIDARNERFAQELKVSDPKYIERTAGVRRLEQLEKLQGLQEKEAEAILSMEQPVRAYMEKNLVPDRDADLAMLDSLVRFANSQKTDIAVAKSQRMTAKQMLEYEDALMAERAEMQRQVNARLIDLEDVKRMQHNLTLAQEQEPMTMADLDELIEKEYVVTVGESNRPILTPKGRRALKNLGLMRLNLETALNAGFTGVERRSPENLARRDQIDRMSEEDREALLYQDPATGTLNKRAFAERGQNADAYATIEADSLEWINDNMNLAAGDRLLARIAGTIEDAVRSVVARGLSELGGDELEQIDLYRTSGKEFVLTGPNEDVIERILQTAKEELAKDTITDGRTDVTPSMTWGKGATPDQADSAASAMRVDRINRGLVADRKKPPTTAKGRTPDGRLQLDEEIPWEGIQADDQVVHDWNDIGTGNSWATVERGDIVEVLTPRLAQFGTITRVFGGESKPRIEVAIGDRRYRFNPERNWLINHPISSAEDIAWITNDETMLDPANIPQVIEDVQIGFMGKGGDAWYADLSTELVTEQMNVSEFMDKTYNPKWHNLRVANAEEEARSEEVKRDIEERFANAPPINLVHDIPMFKIEQPELYHQILQEVRAAGGQTIAGVRGYYDPLHPEDGVYVFTPNVSAAAGLDGTQYEQLIQETIFHEVVGHYGVRALFKNERELEQYMFELVDAFNVGPNSLAKRMEAQLNLYGATTKEFDPARKLLLGEEMVAYTVGLEMSNQLDLTPQQKGIIRKIIDWIKQWLNRFFGQYNDKFVSMTDQRREFWNDDRVRDLVSRALDFTRRGTPYKKTQYEHGRTPFMRDGDIFQWNIQQIFRTATRKLSKNDRRQLASKYGGLENVPKEVPIFPQDGTVKQWENALKSVSTQNNQWGIKKFELEALGLDPDQEWYLFRDLTYHDLMELHGKSRNRVAQDVERDWYKEYMPQGLVNELDGLFAALDNMSMVGPILEAAGEHDRFKLDYDNYSGLKQYRAIRPVTNEVSYQAMAARIKEILDKPIAKNTKITWDIFEQHLSSARAYQIYAEGASGFRELSRERAANLIFNGAPNRGNWLFEDGRNGYDSITQEQKDAIDEAIRLVKSRGPDIGFNPATGEWTDDESLYRGTWDEYVPQGALVGKDYRIHLIKTRGGKFPEMPRMDYHFAPNFLHIRSSVAEFEEVPEGFKSDNPEHDGQAVIVIENQTDWGSKWRDGFEDQEQAVEADALGKKFFGALQSAYLEGSTKTDRLIIDTVTQMALPMIAAMPDSDIESGPIAEQSKRVMEQEAISRYNKPLSALTPEEAQELWHLQYMNRHNGFMAKLNASIDSLSDYLSNNDVDFGKIKSLDARMFDKLDQYAANMYLRQVHQALDQIARTFAQMGDPAQQRASRHRRIIASMVEKARWLNLGKEKLRLPWVKDRVVAVMAQAFEPLGASTESLNKILETFTQQVQTTYTLPKDTLMRLYDVAQIEKLRSQEYRTSRQRRFDDANKHFAMARRIFSEYAQTNFFKDIQTVNGPDTEAMALLADSPISFSYDTTDPDNLGITVSGSPASLQVFELYKDDIIENYIREMVPLNIQSVAENERSQNIEIRELYNKASKSWIEENPDLRDYLIQNAGFYDEPNIWLNEEATRENDQRVLNNHGVQHFYDWVEEYEDEAEEIVKERQDWDSIHDEMGRNEENEEYQRILEEDGQTAADEWLEEQKDDAVLEWEQSEEFHNEVRETVNEIIESRTESENEPYLFVSEIPVSWDEDGDPDEYVEFKIVADDIGANYYVWIDDDWKDYFYELDTAWESAQNIIANYFDGRNTQPPVGEFMGPTNDAMQEEIQKLKEGGFEVPDLQPVVNESRNKFNPKSSEYIDLYDAFRQMVKIDKRFGRDPSDDERVSFIHQYYPYTPLAKDKYWRVTALRYILADAVRRGFGAVVWQDGLATSKRGGTDMGNEDRVAVKRLTWHQEVLEVGGKEVEAFILTSPELQNPVVVTKENAVQVMGLTMSNVMKEQAAGRWNPPAEDNTKPKAVIKLPYNVDQLKEKGHYMINEVVSEVNGRVSYGVHDILEGRFIGFYATESEAQAVIDAEGVDAHTEKYFNRVQQRIENIMSRQESGKDRTPAEREQLGKKRVTSGVIYPEDIGAANLYIIPGYTVYDYQHTYDVPKLAGARMNYEQMSYNVWENELKKYGAKITESLIRIPESSARRAYEREGQRGKIIEEAGQNFVNKYGNTEIVEVKEPNAGFVIMTEKQGPINGRIYNAYEDALKILESLRADEETKMTGSRVYTIVLNDEIKKAFSKPIAPFQYDNRLEGHLKNARSKIKDRGDSIADRFRKLRNRSRVAWQHKYVDMLYGLRNALETADVPDRSYMAARVSVAGLEARVKSALYYGYPTWDEDTTSYGGKGLMEIFTSIGTNPRLWGEYMLGLRGKELMLEGFDKLSPEQQQAITNTVRNLEGDTTKDKIWTYIKSKTKQSVIDLEGAYTLTAEERAELGEAGAKFYDEHLHHFRINGPPVLLDDGTPDPRFKTNPNKWEPWQKKVRRNGPVIDMRRGPLAEEPVSIETGTGRKKKRSEIGVHDDPDMTKWERKKRNMIWTLMSDPRIVDEQGRMKNPANQKLIPGRYSKWEMAIDYGITSEAEAERIINAVQDMGLKKQREKNEAEKNLQEQDLTFEIWENGREKTFSMEELVALEELGNQYPQFERVQKEFAAWWDKLLDFCQEAGVINPETRPFWQSEFYLPLFRIMDDRIGGVFGKNSGIHPNKPIKRLGGQVPKEKRAQLIHFIMHNGPHKRHITSLKKEFGAKVVDAAVKEGLIEALPPPDKIFTRLANPEISPHTRKKLEKRLRALERSPQMQNTDAGREHLIKMGNNVGDPIDNILMNMVRMIDSATTNHWKKMAVDDLIETGMIKKSPVATSTELVPMSEIVKILKKAEFNVDSLPPGFAQSLQKVTALQPLSEKDGYISIFRDGKREYYATDDMMLYESITLINRKNFHENWAWLTLPKRFYTGTITLSPAFMGANAFRDTISASISGRDEIVPFIDSMKGFVSAITTDQTMRTLTSGGASFEAGYITGGDTRATAHMIDKAIARADFQKTLLDDPFKLAKVQLLLAADAYMKVGSSFENASRLALYKAAMKSGKSKLRGLYEALDIMDFSMRGNNTAIQWLCAVIPFMNARIQGLYRTGRGFKERPLSTLWRGSLYMFAGLAVWAMFRDDERYKQLQDWDKATYHHFWIGDDHYRLPRAFEVGAIFTTIPEAWANAIYQDAPDWEKDFFRMHLFVLGETFAMNPIPQATQPMVELMMNYNFFTGRQIVSPYDQRVAQDQFGPRTSETMRELAKVMPDIKIGKGNISSPKHLENLYRGYTGTLGKYLLDVSDWFVRQALDYPLPPAATPSQDWLTGRFYLGSHPPPQTKQQEEYYRMMEKVTSIQQSINFYERTGVDDERMDELLDTEAPYINIADDLEDIREDIRELNQEEMEIGYDLNLTPEEKRKLVDQIVIDRNKLYDEAYQMRPGTELNPLDEPATKEKLIDLIWEWGVNDSELAKKRLQEESPSTLEVLTHIRERMEQRNLRSLAKASRAQEEK